jgi:hypothetical protein
MCTNCMSSQSKDFDPRQFGISNYGALGDKGLAIKTSVRFEGLGAQSQKFEGMAPEKTASASEAEYTGRQ